MSCHAATVKIQTFPPNASAFISTTLRLQSTASIRSRHRNEVKGFAGPSQKLQIMHTSHGRPALVHVDATPREAMSPTNSLVSTSLGWPPRHRSSCTSSNSADPPLSAVRTSQQMPAPSLSSTSLFDATSQSTQNSPSPPVPPEYGQGGTSTQKRTKQRSNPRTTCAYCQRDFPINFDRNNGVHCTQCSRAMEKKVVGSQWEAARKVVDTGIVPEEFVRNKVARRLSVKDLTTIHSTGSSGESSSALNGAHSALDGAQERKKPFSKPTGNVTNTTPDQHTTRSSQKSPSHTYMLGGYIIGAEGTGGAAPGYAPVLGLEGFARSFS